MGMTRVHGCRTIFSRAPAPGSGGLRNGVARRSAEFYYRKSGPVRRWRWEILSPRSFLARPIPANSNFNLIFRKIIARQFNVSVYGNTDGTGWRLHIKGQYLKSLFELIAYKLYSSIIYRGPRILLRACAQ